MNPGHFV